MQICNKGTTRMVILLGSYVLKFPRPNCGIRMFLYGMLANMEEKVWCRKAIPNEPGLPDVLWVSPLGLLAIQIRLRPVKHRGLFWVDLERLIATSSIDRSFWVSDCKPENFAYREGQLVKIDTAT
mgnify:CR=1 FL=1